MTAIRTLTNSAALEELQHEFVLDVRRFDREVHATDLAQLATNTPSGAGSDIGNAIMSVASELGETKAQAGILLVSDGRATAGDPLDAAQLALARSVPLWTWVLGGAVTRHDLWIDTASSEALAFSDAEVELAATLHEVGYPNRSFNVEILRDNQTIETKEVLPDTNGVTHVSTPWMPKPWQRCRNSVARSLQSTVRRYGKRGPVCGRRRRISAHRLPNLIKGGLTSQSPRPASFLRL